MQFARNIGKFLNRKRLQKVNVLLLVMTFYMWPFVSGACIYQITRSNPLPNVRILWPRDHHPYWVITEFNQLDHLCRIKWPPVSVGTENDVFDACTPNYEGSGVHTHKVVGLFWWTGAILARCHSWCHQWLMSVAAELEPRFELAGQ